MNGFALALERRDWQAVALYLLLGVSRAASRLPAESLDELLELLGNAGDRDGAGAREGGA